MPFVVFIIIIIVYFYLFINLVIAYFHKSFGQDLRNYNN